MEIQCPACQEEVASCQQCQADFGPPGAGSSFAAAEAVSVAAAASAVIHVRDESTSAQSASIDAAVDEALRGGSRLNLAPITEQSSECDHGRPGYDCLC